MFKKEDVYMFKKEDVGDDLGALYERLEEQEEREPTPGRSNNFASW